MNCQIVLKLLLILTVTSTCFTYPNFSNDYTVLRIHLDHVHEQYANNLVKQGEDMPASCRKDLCYASTESTLKKGEFMWPEITISHKVELRCPFSFHVPVYTSRVCGLSKDRVAEWKPTDWEHVCPDPPMARVLKKMENQIDAHKSNKGYSQNNESTDHARKLDTMFNDFFSKVMNVFTEYRDTPITMDDINQLTYFISLTPPILQKSEQNIKNTMANSLLHIVNTLMDDDFRANFIIALYDKSKYTQLIKLFEILPYNIEREEDGSGSVVFNNIMVHVVNVTTETDDIIDITHGFIVKINATLTVNTPSVSLHLAKTKEASGTPINVGITIIKNSTILDYNYLWSIPVKTCDKRVTVSRTSTITEYNNNFSTTQSMVTPIEFFNAGPGALLGPDHGPGPRSEIKPNRKKSDDTVEYTGRIQSLAGVIFLTTPNAKAEQIRMTYHAYAANDAKHRNLTEKPAVCVKSTIQDNLRFWKEQDCKTVNVLNNNSYTTCSCEGFGAYGIFHEKPYNKKPPPGSPLPTEIVKTVEKSDISAFLGFEYKKELEILGNVLGVISLTGLLATILSYGIFRHTRRGTPTTILLNLCVALIALSLLLFSIYFTGDVMTINGCIVTNTLRYYLVFVTLVWNAIEAFNMYLMLIKVFGSKISKFILKAGTIAWGVPALMVSVNFAINTKAFNGEYVLISAENGTCSYRCKLRDATLYYGYIVPMAVIIIHNFIVFAFVLKIICKQGSKLGKSERKSKLIQLTGAVATLVLLGVPWMFSAFGAIDATKSGDLAKTEGVFQVVFVIFVNLQGLFIFLFHCARNAKVRNSWSSVVRKTDVRTGSTLSTSASASSIKTTAAQHNTTRDSVKQNGEKSVENFDQI